MILVAVKGLLGRKTRAVLTALAVVLGVAMVSGTYILTDTILKAFNSVFSSSYKNTSVIISGKEIVKGSASGNATVPAALLVRVRAVPDVQAAAGGVINFNGTTDIVKLIDEKGKTIGGRGGAPTFGFGLDPRYPRFNPMKLDQGAWASGPNQVVVEKGTASKHHLRIGDTVRVSADGPTKPFTISGIARLGTVSTIGAATIAVFDVPTAQKLLHKEGQLDAISVAGKPGVSEAKLAGELRPLVPASAQVRTAQSQASSDSKDTTQGINGIRYFLLAFAAIALFVGAFVIFNTIAITVAQRAREFATLRTLGATRRQVLRSVLIEAFVIGLTAALIGLALGLALARGLNAIFVAFGADLPQAGTVFATRTVVVSILAGVIVTVFAGLFPAIQATRVPPIAAIREGAVLPRSRLSRWGPWISGALLVLALVLIADGLFVATGIVGVLIPLALGTLLLFIGVALVSGRLVKPIAAVVGMPARRLGGTAGQLASDNSVRNPGRTANTAAALMIGLALITFVATLGAGLKASETDTLNEQVRSDYVVNAGNGFDPFPAAAGDAVAGASRVSLAASVRSDKARIFGTTVDVAGVGPEIARVYHFKWIKGSDDVTRDRLGTDGAIVSKSFADRNHVGPGDVFTVQPPSGLRLTYAVQGIFDPGQTDPLFSGIMISKVAFDRGFPRPKDLFTFVNVRGGASDSATASLEHSLAAFPDVKLRTKADWVKNRAHGVDTLLLFLYVLLSLSVIVSLFGMVNTLVLTVFERTRELGMLRAIGMTRRQMRRMVRHESVITALIGAGLGLPLGLFLAALVTAGLRGQGVGFHVPILTLAIFTVIAILAGIAAAIVPARRAARLNVLEALQYE
jgi:putative ABC transport system permease protein